MGKPKKYVGETWSNPFDHGGKDYRWDNKKQEYVESTGESPLASIKRSWGETIVPAARQYAERQAKLTKESFKKYTTEKETLVEDIVNKKIEVSNTALYPDLLVGKEMNLVSNTENDISEFFNWRESIDPNSDTGKYLGDLSEHSTFKDNAALNILKTNGGGDTYVNAVKNQKPDVNLGEKQDPTKPIVKQVSDVKYEDDVNPQDPDWKTEKQAWLDDTANSSAARAGLDDELRWQAKQRHDKWKAERNQPETSDQTPKDQIEVPEPQSATQFIEGGLIDAQKDYMSRNYG